MARRCAERRACDAKTHPNERLRNNGENRSIQGIMRELGGSGPHDELKALDALQTLARRGRLQLVPITAEFSALGEEINEQNETHWYEPVE